MQRILIIESSESISSELAGALEGQFRIELVRTPEAALTRFEYEEFDLVVLGGTTPNQVLAKFSELRSQNLILVVDRSDLPRIAESLLTGAADFVTKPVNLIDLAARVQSRILTG